MVPEGAQVDGKLATARVPWNETIMPWSVTVDQSVCNMFMLPF